MIDSVVEGAAPVPDLKRARRRKLAVTEAFNADRLPPHSIEAERGVLGCVLLSPNPCMGESMELLKGNAEVFYDLRHQTIYRTLIQMFDQQQAIDVITLQQRLKDTQPVDEKGRPILCTTCQGSGYFERTGAFELLLITPEVRQLVAGGGNLRDIKSAARKAKMLYLQEQALRKVIAGVTSIQEVLRVSQPAKKA